MSRVEIDPVGSGTGSFYIEETVKVKLNFFSDADIDPESVYFYNFI